MTINANNFVETVRANADNKKLTDKKFRQFVRDTLEIVDNGHTYSVRYEFSVGGYHAMFKNFVGNLDVIKREVGEAVDEFVAELIKSDKIHGDLRAYTPEFANGYPSLDGFEPEAGRDYDLTLLHMTREKNDELLHHNHSFCRELRATIGG